MDLEGKRLLVTGAGAGTGPDGAVETAGSVYAVDGGTMAWRGTRQ
jgi:hypothetical protein